VLSGALSHDRPNLKTAMKAESKLYVNGDLDLNVNKDLTAVLTVDLTMNLTGGLSGEI
jgi:hypothetical protein